MPGTFWNDEQEKILILHMLDSSALISRARATEIGEKMGVHRDSVR
jgi:hypothetical protein